MIKLNTNSKHIVVEYARVKTVMFALCELTESEYVTWQVNPTTLEPFWGHYFSSKALARFDYEKRVESSIN